jgi:hypothetical protein
MSADFAIVTLSLLALALPERNVAGHAYAAAARRAVYVRAR